MGSSRGALVRTVMELKKGQEIFMLVGQEGTNSCVKVTRYHILFTFTKNFFYFFFRALVIKRIHLAILVKIKAPA